jgi:2-alkenal reductase
MKTKIFFATTLLVLVSLACQTSFLPTNNQTQISTPQTLPTFVPENVENTNPTTQQETLVALYENVNRGTVAILTEVGSGSGFVYDSNGHIITNYHVVEGANSIEVRFTSGFMSYATVVGIDTDSDLAVIKVDAPADELFPLPLGDSDLLKVGQTVIAIGNPFGLESTMTVGIISALGRTLDSMRVSPDGASFSAGDVIQTDAAINPGNSGGPLFNINGEVIGINRAIRTTNFTEEGEPINSGIGFAVSINIVKRVVPFLISDGKYDYPFLGISSTDLFSLDMVQALGLTQYTGAYVTGVVPDGPAERAGIIAGSTPTNIPNLLAGGDLIIAIDGNPVQTFDEMLAYLLTHKSPGDVVVMSVLRGDERVDINVTLDKRP